MSAVVPTFGPRRCQVCDGQLDPHEIIHQVCNRPDCRRRFFLDRHLRDIGPKTTALQERTARHRAAAQDSARKLIAQRQNSASVPLAVIPFWEFRLTNLPERRRRAFRDHLMLMLSHATEHRAYTPTENDDPVPTPEVQDLLGRVCAYCEGWCCRGGGNRAYISADTLRRYMAANPHLRPRDVLANYLDRLGHRVNHHSCVYHGPRGCGLPSDMRSDTCNRYFCTGANRLRDELGDSVPAELVVAKEADGEVRSAAMMIGEELRRFELPTFDGNIDASHRR